MYRHSIQNNPSRNFNQGQNYKKTGTLIKILISTKDQIIMGITVKIEIKIQILIRTQIKVKILKLYAIHVIHQDIHLGIVTNK